MPPIPIIRWTVACTRSFSNCTPSRSLLPSEPFIINGLQHLLWRELLRHTPEQHMAVLKGLGTMRHHLGVELDDIVLANVTVVTAVPDGFQSRLRHKGKDHSQKRISFIYDCLNSTYSLTALRAISSMPAASSL